MEIKNFKKGDEIHIFELFELTFKRKMNPKYWYWRFQDNPAGKYLIKLMWDGNKLVGHYAVSPIVMNINGENTLGVLSMTTMTHPEYGRRGIFGLLANALYNELEKEKGVTSIWGFPNSNSHYGFIKNLEWNDLGVMSHLIKNAQEIESLKSADISFSDSFTKEHAVLMNKITNTFQVKVDRNQRYLNWRYKENPNVNYSILDYKENNVLKAFLVIKTYPSENEGIHNIFIIENGIPFENIPLLKIFLSHIKEYYGNKINTFNLWLPLFDTRHIYIEREGFLLGGTPTYLGVRVKNEKNNLVNNFKNWYLSYGDSDVY